jgi:hypothetical protein
MPANVLDQGRCIRLRRDLDRCMARTGVTLAADVQPAIRRQRDGE